MRFRQLQTLARGCPTSGLLEDSWASSPSWVVITQQVDISGKTYTHDNSRFARNIPGFYLQSY